MFFLLKTEPSEYSFADLQRDKEPIWDGVSNPVALKHLRSMTPGQRLVIYETGDVKSAVGTATVVSVDASDLKNPRVRIKAGKPGPACGNQGAEVVRRFSPGAAGQAERGPVERPAILVPGGLEGGATQNAPISAAINRSSFMVPVRAGAGGARSGGRFEAIYPRLSMVSPFSTNACIQPRTRFQPSP